MATQDDAAFDSAVMAGTAIYGKPLLAIYDLYVLGLSNRWAWRCPTPRLLAWYDANVSSRHLDIGVGTGFYLDRCRFAPMPSITLGDLNRNCLDKVSSRIARYRPHAVLMNVFDPRTYPQARFDSIGINYLLHCLPGPPARKLAVLAPLKRLLNDGGVLFGSTILGDEAPHNRFGRLLMNAYNRKGIFCNHEDRRADLDHALNACFGRSKVEVQGCVALFSAQRRGGASS